MKTADQQILKKLDEIKNAQGGVGGGGITEEQVEVIANAKVSDAAYDEAAWNGDDTHAPSKNAVRDKIESMAAPYLVYTALLNQSGTDAPTATVLENTLGEVPAWTYVGVGSYRVTSPNDSFDATKTTIEFGPPGGPFNITAGKSSLPNRYDVQTVLYADNTVTDDVLIGTMVRIQIKKP